MNRKYQSLDMLKIRHLSMFKRFYDPKNEYAEGFLKEYSHWVLEVSYKQHTFGCYIIFCKRKGVEKISNLTDDELLNLKKICLEIETALQKNKIFTPDRFNYLQLGNKLHHLHVHGIPRYAKPRNFDNKIWEDKSFGTVPVWTMNKQSDKTVLKLKNEILRYL